MVTVGENARIAAQAVSEIPDALISKALILFSNRIKEHKDQILKANQEDIQLAIRNNASRAFIDRLTLNEDRVNSLQSVILDIANQRSPVDQILETSVRPNGLEICKVTTPIGVIGVIFESRPNVFCDAAALCIMDVIHPTEATGQANIFT